MFLGLTFGIIIYLLTLSNIIIKTFVFIISLLKKVLKTLIKIIIVPFQFVYKIVDKFIFRPIYISCIKSKSFLTKKTKNLSFKLKNIIKTEKNVKNS